jgi:SAM-dependent methyltransferase
MTILNGIVFFIIIAILVTMLLASAAPWLPTRRKDMARVLALAKIKPAEVLYDLGCGDGRLITEAARAGAVATGFDISVMSYFMALVRIVLERSNARVVFKNFFRQDLSKADIVYLFLTPPAMPAVKNKFDRELKKGTRIISYAFSIPGLAPETIDKQPGRQTIYLYKI